AEIGVPVHIITGDRDLLQLVDENTVVELPPGRYERTAKLFDEAAVEEKYGLKPEQIVDMKALTGDKSDNIPGVAGVGDKTAVSLLQQYGTLDNIYAHLDEVPGRFRTKLAEGRESAYLSQRLARIITDAPLQLEIDRCVTQEYDVREVLKLFQKLEFRSLTSRLAEAAEVMRTRPGELSPTQAIAIGTRDEVTEMVSKLETVQGISCDVETTGLDKMDAELVGISVAIESPVGYYIPVGHLDGEAQASAGQM